jgi:hypothetical protein
VLAEIVITDVVITDVVITDMVITDMVITDIVITDIVSDGDRRPRGAAMLAEIVITNIFITDILSLMHSHHGYSHTDDIAITDALTVTDPIMEIAAPEEQRSSLI